jgi:SAM-dependent methyltransferase
MRNRHLSEYRDRVLPFARGIAVEIGVGSGFNLPLYGSDVERIYGFDPSIELLRIASNRGGAATHSVMLAQASAEDMPIDGHSVDTVVTTWTLCSIPDVERALREARRILKPGGRLVFVKHGLSPDPQVVKWQNRLTPCWRKIGGGCHLNRKIDDLIRAAGFRIDSPRTGYMKGPRPMTFMYEGWATPLP